MGSACRLSTNVIRLSKSISKHSLRSFLHCAECVFLAPSGSAKFIAFWCKKNRRATVGLPDSMMFDSLFFSICPQVSLRASRIRYSVKKQKVKPTRSSRDRRPAACQSAHPR
ncbi:hypothetical protein DUA64_17645 [Salmonella enterica subsp. enterica serovar Abony]|nr:hypothetical protein [Salmonella enterica subsp. enterica serovar Abony]EBY6399964.1 hypothetical protein [Salmonella enterica subsp. enterica serovar Abony]